MQYQISLRVVGPTLFHHLPDSTIVLSSVLAIQPTCLCVRGTSWIRITQEALNTCKYRRNIIYWAPVILKDIKAYLSIIIDVGVEHFGNKLDGGGLVRVRFREFQYQLKGSTFPWSVVRSKNNCLPVKDIIVKRCTRHAAWGVMLEPFEIAKKPSAC